MDWGTIGAAIGGSVAASLGVLKAVPHLFNAHNGASPRGHYDDDDRIREVIGSAIEGKLGLVLSRQTDILERMEKGQERMEQTLGDNTMALQVFMRVEQARGRSIEGG